MSELETKDQQTVRTCIAAEYLKLSKELEILEKKMESLAIILKKEQPFVEFFPTEERKVQLLEGAKMTEVDNQVVEELTFAELKKIVKVTEVALKELGREELILKYKKETGKKAPSLQVKPLSKEDWKKLQG